MKYIVANPEKITIRQANWQHSFNALHPALESLEVVKSGTTSFEQAEKWLECICKVHPMPIAQMTLNQANGLGAKEIRALTAHENGEYYPALSAQEIYQAKQLTVFPLDFSISRGEEPFILNAIRETLEEQNSIVRDKGREQAMLQGGNSWLKSRPSLCGQINDQNIIADIHVNSYENMTSSDEIRLHYHELVSVSLDMPQSQLFQVNLKIKPEIRDQLINFASLSAASQEHAKDLLKEMLRSKSPDVELVTNVVQANSTIFDEICNVGQKHWDAITTGQTIDYSKVKERRPLPDEIKEQYIDLSKELVATRKLSDYATARAKSLSKSFSDFAIAAGIDKNTQLPYDATHIGISNKYNLEAIASLLTSMGNVKDHELRESKINKNIIFELLEQKGPTASLSQSEIMTAMEYGKYDKDTVLMMAQNASINPEEFSVVEVKPYVGTQKRNAVSDILRAFETETAKQCEETISTLQASSTLDHPNLSSELKNSGMSYRMDF